METLAVLPVKPLGQAKSRLRSAFGSATEQLALAMLQDVLLAAREADQIDDIVLLTNDAKAARAGVELGARTLPDGPDRGLNPALRWADLQLRRARPTSALMVLPMDCPATTAADLNGFVLFLKRSQQRCFVADHLGIGTTVLGAPAGSALDPRYGTHSCADHVASGAHRIAANSWPRLAADIDTAVDLAQTEEHFGLGPHTTAWLAGQPG